jgi:hypothetical protein
MNIKILKKINQLVKIDKTDDKYIVKYRKSVMEKWQDDNIFSNIKLAIRRKHNLTHIIIRDIGLFIYFKNRRIKKQKINKKQ